MFSDYTNRLLCSARDFVQQVACFPTYVHLYLNIFQLGVMYHWLPINIWYSDTQLTTTHFLLNDAGNQGFTAGVAEFLGYGGQALNQQRQRPFCQLAQANHVTSSNHLSIMRTITMTIIIWTSCHSNHLSVIGTITVTITIWTLYHSAHLSIMGTITVTIIIIMDIIIITVLTCQSWGQITTTILIWTSYHSAHLSIMGTITVTIIIIMDIISQCSLANHGDKSQWQSQYEHYITVLICQSWGQSQWWS